MELQNLSKFIKMSNKWLMNLSGVDRKALDVKSSLSRLRPVMDPQEFKSVYEYIKQSIRDMINPLAKEATRVLIMDELIRWANPQTYLTPDVRKGTLIAAVNELGDPNLTIETKQRILSDALTKGAPTSQIKTRTQMIRMALDKVILKLTAMCQPLRHRSDYGTTRDVAERLKKFQDDEIEAAMIKKLVLPNPQPVLNYDDPQVLSNVLKRTQ